MSTFFKEFDEGDNNVSSDNRKVLLLEFPHEETLKYLKKRLKGCQF